jgi:sterol desaturase/sphingolipid hydroxylase (fatty acid hydroxylase superfamily)
MNTMAVPLALMLAAVLAELLLLRYLRGQTIPWLEVISNLDSGHLMLWLFRGAEVAGYGWLVHHASLGWAPHWPAWSVWLLAFFAWDLGFYWLHRLHHRFGWLWAIHQVHHEGEHFTLSLGVRNSWYSSLTSLPFFAPLALLGVPLHVFVAVSSFHYAVQFYNHCALVKNSGWLDRILVTPRHHRIHHGADAPYLDKNFGGTLLLWDLLFGTFQREVPETPLRYGMAHWPRSHNPFWVNQLPLLHWLGWRAPRISLRPISTTQTRWVASGGVLLFAVVVYYVARQGTWPSGAPQAWLFTLLAAATLALGGLSDGRRWGAALWCALGVAVPIVLIGVFHVRDPLGCLLMALLGLHAAALPVRFWRHLSIADTTV